MKRIRMEWTWGNDMVTHWVFKHMVGVFLNEHRKLISEGPNVLRHGDVDRRNSLPS
jgi:hypothetical protein